MRPIPQFDHAADVYDEYALFQHSETARVLDAALMVFPEHARIVDIGCGTGYFAEIARAHRPGWQVVGVDIARPMCARAATRCVAIQADAVALPLADASCDAVVSSLCLQWVEDLPRAFAEIVRVLRPGGRAVIASLASESLLELRTMAAHAQLSLRLLSMLPATQYEYAARLSGVSISMYTRDAAVEYAENVPALLHSMRRIGANLPASSGSFMGAQRFKQLARGYEKLRTPQGLPVTWDRVFMVMSKPV